MEAPPFPSPVGVIVVFAGRQKGINLETKYWETDK